MLRRHGRQRNLPATIVRAAKVAGVGLAYAAHKLANSPDVQTAVNKIISHGVNKGVNYVTGSGQLPPTPLGTGRKPTAPGGSYTYSIPAAPQFGARAGGSGGGIAYRSGSRRKSGGRRRTVRRTVKRKTLSKQLWKRGASKHIEYGGICARAAAADSVQLGHATVAHHTVIRVMFMSVLKSLFHVVV